VCSFAENRTLSAATSQISKIAVPKHFSAQVLQFALAPTLLRGCGALLRKYRLFLRLPLTYRSKTAVPKRCSLRFLAVLCGHRALLWRYRALAAVTTQISIKNSIVQALQFAVARTACKGRRPPPPFIVRMPSFPVCNT